MQNSVCMSVFWKKLCDHSFNFNNMYTKIILHLSLFFQDFTHHIFSLVTRTSSLGSTQKGAREERPWFKLVTCLGDKFMFVGGVPAFQNIVAVGICNIQNRPCFSLGNLRKLFFDCVAELYHIYHNTYNI